MVNNRKRYRYVLALLTCIGFASCEKFLDSKPKDFLSPVNYYNTEEQINFALNAVYDVLGQRGMYGDALISRMGTEADEGFYAVRSFKGPQVYDFSSSDSYVTTLWQLLYDGINRANILIENIDKPNLTKEKRNDILGQAKFLRAYYYFLLVSNWGDVPVIMNATSSANNTGVPQTPAREVYELIIKEMEEAELLVRDASEVGFGGKVSKSAVQGILARVCLYMASNPVNDVSKYNDVIKWTSKIINPGFHKLNASYENIFIKYAADEYDVKESIWEVEFWGNTLGQYREGGRVGINTGIANPNTTLGYAYGFIQTTAKLFNSYGEGDLRRDWAIAPFRYQSNGTIKANWNPTQIYQRFCGKWRREYEVVTPKSTNDSPQNFPLLRYSDVLLMHAEALHKLNETEDALTFLNQVRRRAYGKLLYGERLKTITLTSGGTGYTTVPTITIMGGDPTVNAIARATISGGKVTSVIIENSGTFYKSAPTISITGGGGSGAVATATITSVTDVDIVLSPELNFMKVIQDERSRELCFEGLRKQDLIRWGILKTTMQQVANDFLTSAPADYNYAANAGNNIAEPKHLLLPIPAYDMGLNPLLNPNIDW